MYLLRQQAAHAAGAARLGPRTSEVWAGASTAACLLPSSWRKRHGTLPTLPSGLHPAALVREFLLEGLQMYEATWDKKGRRFPIRRKPLW